MSATASETGGPLPARLCALVVDDEPPLVRLVASYLAREGFEVATAGDGTQAVELARELRPDVIVLDLMLPGLDGIEACRRIRAFSDAYILMLTARAEDLDKIVGLSTGADDYMTKPFSPGELVARVRAMLRRPRSATTGEPARRLGALTIDPGAREVLVAGHPVELTKLEFDVLDALTEHPGLVLTRRQILERVWGTSWPGDEHVVEVHVAKLRAKLGGDRPGRFIETVRGVGYRIGRQP